MDRDNRTSSFSSSVSSDSSSDGDNSHVYHNARIYADADDGQQQQQQQQQQQHDHVYDHLGQLQPNGNGNGHLHDNVVDGVSSPYDDFSLPVRPPQPLPAQLNEDGSHYDPMPVRHPQSVASDPTYATIPTILSQVDSKAFVRKGSTRSAHVVKDANVPAHYHAAKDKLLRQSREVIALLTLQEKAFTKMDDLDAQRQAMNTMHHVSELLAKPIDVITCCLLDMGVENDILQEHLRLSQLSQKELIIAQQQQMSASRRQSSHSAQTNPPMHKDLDVGSSDGPNNKNDDHTDDNDDGKDPSKATAALHSTALSPYVIIETIECTHMQNASQHAFYADPDNPVPIGGELYGRYVSPKDNRFIVGLATGPGQHGKLTHNVYRGNKDDIREMKRAVTEASERSGLTQYFIGGWTTSESGKVSKHTHHAIKRTMSAFKIPMYVLILMCKLGKDRVFPRAFCFQNTSMQCTELNVSVVKSLRPLFTVKPVASTSLKVSLTYDEKFRKTAGVSKWSIIQQSCFNSQDKAKGNPSLVKWKQYLQLTLQELNSHLHAMRNVVYWYSMGEINHALSLRFIVDEGMPSSPSSQHPTKKHSLPPASLSMSLPRLVEYVVLIYCIPNDSMDQLVTIMLDDKVLMKVQLQTFKDTPAITSPITNFLKDRLQRICDRKKPTK